MERLVGSQSENPTVQVLGGIVLQGVGKAEEALSLLGKHQGSLEAYEHLTIRLRWIVAADSNASFSIALTVQIHLQQNRTDLALKEVQAARKWAQDSLLVNIAESWVALRLVCPLSQYPESSR